ncbi:MAG: response regulator transcription factor [Deltaproteobacteria bacterium]|nr:response regulator transcription factor [Deltaproteobacteria bacterium]
MNAVIIDDEGNVRNTIKSLLSGYFPDINIIAVAGSVSKGYEALVKYQPDILFLDIELPDGTGFDLLKKFPRISFKIIFVTGHDEYAINAIKVSALDYMLKPIDAEEFCNAVEKAREIINQTEQQFKFQALIENLQGRKMLKRIILHTSDHLQLVSVSDIVRAEADSNYTRFHLTGDHKIMVSQTLKEFDALLSGSGLIRVHQSHLVNIYYIDRFVKKEGGYLILKNGTKVPVSPKLKKQVLQALTEHLFD